MSSASNRATHLDDPQGDETTDEPRSLHRGSGVTGPASEQATAVQATGNDSVEEAILYAKKYIEDLLSFFGLNIDVYATTEDGEVIELSVPSTHLNGFLIGQHGDTMRSLQYMISTALRNQNYSHARVNVDVADYKRNRADRLAKQAEDWFKEVKESGKAKDLAPMNAADRRVVHKAASDFGIETESVGMGRDRHIVLKPFEQVESPAPVE